MIDLEVPSGKVSSEHTHKRGMKFEKMHDTHTMNSIKSEHNEHANHKALKGSVTAA